MATTLRELAEALDVSPMTVSRAIRGKTGVSETSRRRIVEAARRHAYPVPNEIWRSCSARTQVICSLVGSEDATDEQDFNNRLLRGMQTAARELGSDLVNFAERTDQWPRIVTRGQVDGVIRVPGGDQRCVPALRCPLPCVAVLARYDNDDVATVDHFDGACQLGRHLAEIGHRKVAFIGPDDWIARERLAGLRVGLETAGCELGSDAVCLQPWAMSPESVAILMTELLKDTPLSGAALRDRFTAIAVYNDYMAVAAMSWLRARGVDVPRDISVTGFDGALPRRLGDAHLTTAGIPLEQLGAEAVRLLYWRLEHPDVPPRRLVLPVTLIHGETARDVRGAAQGVA